MASAKAVAKKGFNVSMSKGSNAKSKMSNIGIYAAMGAYNLIITIGLVFTSILLLVGIAYLGVVLANALLGAFGFTMIDFITMFSAVVIGVFIAGVMIFFYTLTLKTIFKLVRNKMWYIEKQNGKPVLIKGKKDPMSTK